MRLYCLARIAEGEMTLHPDYPVEGADISSYQGTVDYVVASQRMQFLFIRAGSPYLGGDMKDSQFDRNQQESKGKIPRGFYFVFRPETSIQVQMDAFLDIIQDDIGELPPVLDVERNDSKLPPNQFTNRLVEAIRYLEKSALLANIKVALYSSSGFWNYNVEKGRINYTGRTLWIANYSSNPTQVLDKPTIPRDWPYWTIWQLSADGNGLGKEFGVQSYSIDVDVFNGSAQQFFNWFGVEPNDTSSGGGGGTDPTQNPPDFVITRTNLNIRNGPGVTYQKIGSALKNSRWSVSAVVQGSDGLWVKIAEEVYIAYWLCDPVFL